MNKERLEQLRQWAKEYGGHIVPYPGSVTGWKLVKNLDSQKYLYIEANTRKEWIRKYLTGK